MEVTNITEEGATFVAEVYEEGNVEIKEHGFTWALSRPDASENERVFLGSFTGTGRYEAEISTALEEGITYQVCAFVKAGDYTVYGDTVKFMSLGSGAPEITDFLPKSAGWGDTVTITGRRFSYLNFTNKVIIDDFMFAPFYSNDTLLKFVLPPEVIKSENSVSVSISGNVAMATGTLTLIPPEAYGFAPESGHWGDTIIVKGLYLSGLGPYPLDGLWLNSSLKCNAFLRTMDSAAFVIPNELDKVTSSVSLSYNTFTFDFPGTFTLLPPETGSLFPGEGTWGNTVTLYGRFNPVKTLNTVLFDDISAKVLYSSFDSIMVEVPQTLANPSSSITYKAGPFTSTFIDPFILKGPEIREFNPKTGLVGDLITIKGKYFRKGLTSVKIGGVTAPIRTINDSIITCHMPGSIYGVCSLSVTVGGSTTDAFEKFTSTNYRITGIDLTNVNYGDTITVFGEYFRSGLIWNLGIINISPIFLSTEQVRFVIPLSLSYTPVSISATYNYWYDGISLKSFSASEEMIYLNDFTVTDITPLSGKAGDLLEITGTNFGSVYVTFGSVNATVTESSYTGITVRVPAISSGEHDIKITSGNRTLTYPLKYSHSGPWLRLNDLPFLYDYACVFDFGEEVYVATAGTSAYNRDVYRFDIDTYGFEKVGNNISSEILNPISCVLDGKGYVIGQRGQSPYGIPFEVFNPDSLTWRSLPPYPGSQGVNPCIVADDSVVYAGCGKLAATSTYVWYTDFWKYSPKTNTWTRLADFPCPYTFFSNQIFLNGKIYFHSCRYNDATYEYLPASNTWVKVVDGVIGSLGARVNTELDGKWYIGFGDWWAYHVNYYSTNPNINNGFYCFDPSTNLWKTIDDVAVSARTFPLSFSAGGYIFIGGSQYTHLYDFWRYDPQLDQ
jgi:N-acetylneuraminic acid mutarotase